MSRLCRANEAVSPATENTEIAGVEREHLDPEGWRNREDTGRRNPSSFAVYRSFPDPSVGKSGFLFPCTDQQPPLFSN